MAQSSQFDIIAIGGGAAGLVTAAGAAGLGARAALIERDRMGGECLWTGCVPSKALIAAARVAAQVRDAGRYGVRASIDAIDFPAVMAHVRAAQERIAPHDSPERFRALGVEVVEGSAQFIDERTVDVEGRRLQARHIVIATGSKPIVPDIPGLRDVPYHTNETIFELVRQPPSMVVLGGGAIGVELAQAFARLGTETTIIEALSLLPREDEEVSAALTELLRADGVRVIAGNKARRVLREADQVVVELDDGAQVRAATLVVAVGRFANHQALGLSRAGVQSFTGGLQLDARLQTTARGVWAAGDVTGAPRFTHVADYQARLVLRNALFPFSAKANYEQVPWVTYTDPELAHLGLTEREARERYGDAIQVWTKPFAQLDRAIADGRTAGLVKLIAQRNGKLIGAHVLGEGASALIAEVALAMRHGLKLSQIGNTIHAYPTYPEAVRQAAELPNRAKLTGATRRFVSWLVSGRHR